MFPDPQELMEEFRAKHIGGRVNSASGGSAPTVRLPLRAHGTLLYACRGAQRLGGCQKN